MARATVRSRELAIRAALGAGRQVLIRQLLTESVLLAIVGGAFGVLLAFWGVDLILALEPGEIPRVAPIAVNGQALSFAVGLSVITGLLFGAVPAWQASRPELQNTLKDATRGTTGDGHRHIARMSLVLAEVALSLVLLVGAGLLFRSLMNLLNVPLGFSSSQITTMQVAPTGEGYRSPEQAVAYWERVLERVQAVPGVEKVALTNSMMSVIGVRPKGRLRPFGTFGAGVIHAHTCENGCANTTAWTDWGLSGGGGAFYFFNETFGLRGDARYFSTAGRENGVGFWRITIGATFLWSAD